MKERIDPELFSHLVDLAALQLTQKESDYLRAELNKQLQAIDELVAIPLEEGAAVTSHGVPYPPEIRPEIRADKSILCEEADDILAQAPKIEDRYFVVPDIPRETLK